MLSILKSERHVIEQCGYEFIPLILRHAHSSRLIAQQGCVEKEELPRGVQFAARDGRDEGRL
jgi:hypothetical protein